MSDYEILELFSQKCLTPLAIIKDIQIAISELRPNIPEPRKSKVITLGLNHELGAIND